MILLILLWFVCWVWHTYDVEKSMQRIEESLRWQR